MPIDPSIPLQVKNVKLESPMNQLAMMGEAVKLSEMQRGVDTQNKLRELYSQGIDVGTPEGFKQVAALDPATALKLRADALQGQKLQGEIKKTGFELTEKGMGIMRERSKDLLQNPSNENYIAHIQEGLRDGLISPEQAKRSVQIYTAIPANERVAYITQGLARAEKIYETKTISAAQQQTADIQKGQLEVSRGNLEIAKENQKRGTIPAGYRMTKEGTLEAIPGGPTTTNLSPKEIQARESKFPQATQAVKTFEAKSTELEKDLLALKNHPGLPSITGIVAGRAPGITADGRAAEALYDKIMARGGFKELQDMRAASPTGGALGNVSNQEGTQLRAAFAAIDRKQDAADVQRAIDTAIADLQGSKGRVREAYDMTYEYKGGGGAPPPPPPPPPPPGASGNTVTIPNGKVLTFPTPEAAAAYKKAANIK